MTGWGVLKRSRTRERGNTSPAWRDRDNPISPELIPLYAAELPEAFALTPASSRSSPLSGSGAFTPSAAAASAAHEEDASLAAAAAA